MTSHCCVTGMWSSNQLYGGQGNLQVKRLLNLPLLFAYVGFHMVRRLKIGPYRDNRYEPTTTVKAGTGD